MRTFIKGFFKENAICCQVLGLCSALAVTNKLQNALAMGFGVVFVVILSSFAVSALRKYIPQEYRIITYMVLTSALVIFFDQLLKAYFSELSNQLGPYVALIITNCIVMGRQEAFAIKNPMWLSIVDGAANSMGYMFALMIIGSIREVLAFGSILNIPVVSAGFTKWVVMAMAPGAFFLLAIYIWLFKIIAKLQPDEN